MIRITYIINGCKFRRTFSKWERNEAVTRIAVLRENGIDVKVEVRT